GTDLMGCSARSRRAVVIQIFFFFTSRRRHTRWPRDWSSDVCSSDLFQHLVASRLERDSNRARGGWLRGVGSSRRSRRVAPAAREIGRASCRERVEIALVAVVLGGEDERGWGGGGRCSEGTAQRRVSA